MATSKRARQIIAGDQPLLDKDAEGMKPLSIAVEELAESKIRILEMTKKNKVSTDTLFYFKV